MTINLANFQLRAIKSLLEAMETSPAARLSLKVLPEAVKP